MPKADMLLGTDFFLSHRILVSQSQNKIYFSYNGGPVFTTQRIAPAPLAEASSDVPPTSTPAAVTPAPTNASDFARRGSALAARREYPAAIADFTKAIELEPANAEFYQDRAEARIALRQPVLAISDLDEALKRRPDDVQALMTRGEVSLRSNDVGRATADFEVADQKIAPQNTNLPIRAPALHTPRRANMSWRSTNTTAG